MFVFEKIYTYVLLILLGGIVVVAFNIFYPNLTFREGDYGKKVKAIHWFKWGFSILLAVVNLVSLFADFQYSFTKKFTTMINLFAALLMVYDIFYTQKKREEYIISLQDKLLKEISFDEIFDFDENIADYNIKENDSSMIYKVIKAETGYVLSSKKGEVNQLLRPKYALSKHEIEFLGKQINFFWTEHNSLPKVLKVFENRELYEQCSEYIWINSPKISFLFNKKFQNAFVAVVFVILLMALWLYIILYGFIIEPYGSIAEWFKQLK